MRVGRKRVTLSTMRQSLICLFSVAGVQLFGCNMREHGVVADFQNTTDVAPAGERSIETFATPLVAAAGESITVYCVVRQDEVHVLEASTEIDVTPYPGPIGLGEDNSFTLHPTAAGTYHVSCHGTTDAIRDFRGVQLEVGAGAPGAIETFLDTHIAPAGTPVKVGCDVYDGFGNPIEDAEASHVVAGNAILVGPSLGGDFVVRGTEIGDFEIACGLSGTVDATPELLTITVGQPGASQTSVDVDEILPNEIVTVSCEVTDAFGNPLDGVTTSFVVVAADGTSALDAGVNIADGTFTAEKAGVYYVFCQIPGMQAGDETPATVNIKSGLPCTWVVDIIVEDCYWQGRRLPANFIVFDRFGNVVEDAIVEMSATPATGVVNDAPGSWVFTAEGDFILSFTLVGTVDGQCVGEPGFAATPEIVDIRVDSVGPVFDINPVRAEMMAAGTAFDQTVTLSGSLTDATSTIVSASLAGVDLGADGTVGSIPISVGQTSRWGLSIVDGAARDECGNRTILAQSYLRSGDTTSTGYLAAATSPNTEARVSKGILAQLNQELIDDNDNLMDDLASIGEAVLLSMDFDDLVDPGYVFASSGYGSSCGWFDFDSKYRVRRPDSSPPSIVVEGPYITQLRAVDGGLQIAVHVGDSSPGRGFEFPLELWTRQCTGVSGLGLTISSSGTAYANSIDLTANLGVTLSGGAPNVSVSSVSIDASDLGVDMDCPNWIDWLCDWLVDTLVGLLANMIENAIEDAVAAQIPPLVGDLLAGFTLDTGFDIPEPLNMHMELSSGFDRIIFCGPAVSGLSRPSGCPSTSPNPGYGQLGLYTQVYPNARGSDIPSTAPGAIRKSGSLPTFSNSNYQFGLGLKDDLLNQILWAVWYGGGLDLDANTINNLIGVGYEGIEMSLYFETPPVIMPGRDGWELQIGIGDAYVNAAIDLGALIGGTSSGNLNVGLYLSTIIGGSLEINGDQLDVSLDTNPEIYVEVVDIDDPGYRAAMSEVFTELLRLILPRILGSVLQSFPIPEINLAGVLGMVCTDDSQCPSGWTCDPVTSTRSECATVWSLNNPAIDRASDYYRLTGSLQ